MEDKYRALGLTSQDLIVVGAFLISTQSEKGGLLCDVSAFGSHLPRRDQAVQLGFKATQSVSKGKDIQNYKGLSIRIIVETLREKCWPFLTTEI